MNIGNSKGAEFKRVLIIPTKPMLEYIEKSDLNVLKIESKSKFYVALTRAINSVAIVINSTKKVSDKFKLYLYKKNDD
jgi:superfamily I DNA/RNA helicase